MGINMSVANLFQSTLPARGATKDPLAQEKAELISIHAPRTGSDERPACTRKSGAYFNPRSPHGERQLRTGKHVAARYFNPRSPHGERRSCSLSSFSLFRDFNPRSPHGERPGAGLPNQPGHDISIHAPRTGSDHNRALLLSSTSCISIHAPRTGSDHHVGADQAVRVISIHAPRTGSDERLHERRRFHRRISIHAPRTGSDRVIRGMPCRLATFQSTLPARGATNALVVHLGNALCISIHAPRTGSDRRKHANSARASNFNPRSPHGERHDFVTFLCVYDNFNPRSPHGERRYSASVSTSGIVFQSTLPARGATFFVPCVARI